jgi:hypothetical protein
VTYPGSTPVGNATLVVANVLTCNKHSQKITLLHTSVAVQDLTCFSSSFYQINNQT